MTMTDVSGASIPVLIGARGWIDGERYALRDGDTITIGRSRSCNISLRRVVTYLEMSPSTRDTDRDFNTVSRRHVRLQVMGNAIRIEDLSTNGTFINDEQIDKIRELTLGGDPAQLRLGTRETWLIQLASQDQAADWQRPCPGSGTG